MDYFFKDYLSMTQSGAGILLPLCKIEITKNQAFIPEVDSKLKISKFLSFEYNENYNIISGNEVKLIKKEAYYEFAFFNQNKKLISGNTNPENIKKILNNLEFEGLPLITKLALSHLLKLKITDRLDFINEFSKVYLKTEIEKDIFVDSSLKLTQKINYYVSVTSEKHFRTDNINFFSDIFDKMGKSKLHRFIFDDVFARETLTNIKFENLEILQKKASITHIKRYRDEDVIFKVFTEFHLSESDEDISFIDRELFNIFIINSQSLYSENSFSDFIIMIIEEGKMLNLLYKENQNYFIYFFKKYIINEFYKFDIQSIILNYLYNNENNEFVVTYMLDCLFDETYIKLEKFFENEIEELIDLLKHETSFIRYAHIDEINALKIKNCLSILNDTLRYLGDGVN